MKRIHRIGFVAATLVCASGSIVAVGALSPPETSLNNCQEKVRAEGKLFVQNTVLAVGTCLKSVANDVIKNHVPLPALSPATLAQCVTQFRKINDSRSGVHSLAQKLKSHVDTKCVPGGPNTHTLQDILGSGAGVNEPLKAENINTWCTHFGGDGSIASVTDWEDCIIASHNCEMATAIAAQYPRAAEWLGALEPQIFSILPPPTDSDKIMDVFFGVDLFRSLIDPDGDGIPNVTCGSGSVACSNACCIVMDSGGADTMCFEYTGPAAGVTAFVASCVPPSATGALTISGGPGACTVIAGPSCVGPNIKVLPRDSSCP